MLTIHDVLRQCDDAGFYDGLFTLRQLIPVHKSLICCIDVLASQVAPETQTLAQLEIGHPDKHILSLPLVWASDDEKSVCQQILSYSREEGNEHDETKRDDHTSNERSIRDDARRLLVIQYLVHKVSVAAKSSSPENRNTHLVTLKNLLVPFLLRSPYLVEDLIGSLLEILEAVALGAANNSQSSSQEHELELDDWRAVLQQCLSNAELSTPAASRTSCRVLGRLNTMLVTQESSTPLQEILVQALYDKLGTVLDATLSCCTAVSSDHHSNLLTKSLSILSKDLLPLVATQTDDDSKSDHDRFLKSLHLPHIEALWSRIFTRYEELVVNAKDSDAGETLGLFWRSNATCRLVLVVLSSALCPLLPGLIQNELPVLVTSGDAGSSTTVKALPFEQPLLWDLIFTCLSQGKSLAVESSTSYRSASTRESNSPQQVNPANTIPQTAVWQSSSATLRKRASYLLRTLVESPLSEERLTQKEISPPVQWMTYIMCVETLTSESEQHLVDQVWDSVASLLRQIHSSSEGDVEVGRALITWDWMSLLFSCILSNDHTSIRKWGMYRFLKGHTGLSIVPGSVAATEDQSNQANGATKHDESTKKKKQPKKKKKAGIEKASNKHQGGPSATLEIVDPEFVLFILLPSWDSLGVSMGYAIHVDNKGKVEREDMVPMMGEFLRAYIQSLYNSTDKETTARRRKRQYTFWNALLSPALISKLHIKTILFLYTTISAELDQIVQSNSGATASLIPADESLLRTLTETYQNLFSTSMVLTHRIELLQALAIMLANSKCPAESTNRWTPKCILQILTLFSPKYFPLDSDEWNLSQDPILKQVAKWIMERFDGSGCTLGSTVASAFVGGDMLPSGTKWDPLVGSTSSEQSLGWAIPLLCTLATMDDSILGTESTDVSSDHRATRTTSAELLWPAIHKGLAQAPGAIMSNGNGKASNVSRALLLLDNGCRLRQLSGLGNGDLLVDRQTQNLMPPPPNIEAMLSNGIMFLLYQLRSLLSIDDGVDSGTTGESLRSNEAKLVSKTYSGLIHQLRILHSSFPSSTVISEAVNELLTSSFQSLSAEGASTGGTEMVKHVALVYAALAAGADPRASSGEGFERCIAMLRMLLSLKLRGGSVPRTKVQTARSLLQFTKWGATSCLIPLLLDIVGPTAEKSRVDEVHKLLEDLLDSAADAVDGAPAGALIPLSKIVLLAGNRWIDVSIDEGAAIDVQTKDRIYAKNVRRVVDCLLTLMDECHVSSESTYMLNEMCGMLFQHKLLFDEYQRLTRNPDYQTPIRGAFRSLIAMAGTQRPHVTKSVISRITVGWLGIDSEDSAVKERSLGLSAIPYREDILNLLLHKETSVEESGSNQSARRHTDKASTALDLPQHTDELSVTRGFLLVFLSKLPSVGEGLHPDVLKQLLHFVILQLLEKATPAKSNHPSIVMKGTPNYCIKMRAWQSLCNLSRFVTSEIAQEVCNFAFTCMQEQVHNQIRYFLENFTIVCGRYHPAVFGEAFLAEVSRTDIHLQHISSLVSLLLMIFHRSDGVDCLIPSFVSTVPLHR